MSLCRECALCVLCTVCVLCVSFVGHIGCEKCKNVKNDAKDINQNSFKFFGESACRPECPSIIVCSAVRRVYRVCISVRLGIHLILFIIDT